MTADVSYALRQYLYVSSKDAAIEMLTNGGSSLALEIAKFWESRVNKTDDRNDIVGKKKTCSRLFYYLKYTS